MQRIPSPCPHWTCPAAGTQRENVLVLHQVKAYRSGATTSDAKLGGRLPASRYSLASNGRPHDR